MHWKTLGCLPGTSYLLSIGKEVFSNTCRLRCASMSDACYSEVSLLHVVTYCFYIGSDHLPQVPLLWSRVEELGGRVWSSSPKNSVGGLNTIGSGDGMV